MTRLPRRTFLLSSAATLSCAATTVGYMRYWESEAIEFSSTSIPISRVSLKRQLRILHLSDLHASPTVSFEYLEQCIAKAVQQTPDVIVITGDFFTRRCSNIPRYVEVLKPLAATAPTFAVAGNHDGGAWAGLGKGYTTLEPLADLLSRAEITFLHNRATQITCGGETLTLVGVGDLWNDDINAELAFSSVVHASDSPILLLSHNPDSKDELAPYPWDLMLCGHTHGGQLVVPFIDYRPFLPIRDRDYAEGLHQYHNRYIYISRGVGNLHGLRFNCRPEASLLLLIS